MWWIVPPPTRLVVMHRVRDSRPLRCRRVANQKFATGDCKMRRLRFKILYFTNYLTTSMKMVWIKNEAPKVNVRLPCKNQTACLNVADAICDHPDQRERAEPSECQRGWLDSIAWSWINNARIKRLGSVRMIQRMATQESNAVSEEWKRWYHVVTWNDRSYCLRFYLYATNLPLLKEKVDLCVVLVKRGEK